MDCRLRGNDSVGNRTRSSRITACALQLKRANVPRYLSESIKETVCCGSNHSVRITLPHLAISCCIKAAIFADVWVASGDAIFPTETLLSHIVPSNPREPDSATVGTARARVRHALRRRQ